MITRRLSLDEAVAIDALVLDTDASTVGGIVKIGLLDSALQAPFVGFGDIHLYPQDWQRLGVLCSRIVLNHPFLDGNKRTGVGGLIIWRWGGLVWRWCLRPGLGSWEGWVS